MTSAFVDNLLKRFTAQGAQGLRFETGQPAVIVEAGGSTRNGTTRTLTLKEILGAIGPIVPEQNRSEMSKSPSLEFVYTVPAVGDFNVRILGNGDHLAVSILRAVAPAAASNINGVRSAAAPVPSAAGNSESSSTIPRPAEPHAAPASIAPPSPIAPPASIAPPAAIAARAPIGHASPAPAIDALFHGMCAMKASDLHISAGMPPLVRKDGEICLLDEQAALFTPDDVVQLLEPIMPEKNREEFRRRHDTEFAYEIAGLGRFRANVFMNRKGSGGVFRVIPSKILTAEDLGLSPHILQLCRLNKGLVLVTGPTGSGKSTTLCAMIDYINRHRSDHIITIEDPIEFVHENKKCLINQREVHTHTSSFKDALRAALREDPDIILVGEMRDLETVAIAIETAETGHLVFGTLHTTTAASTVDRVIDQFPSDRQGQIRIMLSESLKGVIAQTLCKKIGGGRAAALEVLIVTSAMSNLIREAKTFQIPSMMQAGKALGMTTLNDSLMELVTKKLVEPQEAYLKSVDKGGFEGLLKRAGIDTKFVQPQTNN
jgi:twitching motility protein PilT